MPGLQPLVVDHVGKRRIAMVDELVFVERQERLWNLENLAEAGVEKEHEWRATFGTLSIESELSPHPVVREGRELARFLGECLGDQPIPLRPAVQRMYAIHPPVERRSCVLFHELLVAVGALEGIRHNRATCDARDPIGHEIALSETWEETTQWLCSRWAYRVEAP